LSYLLVLKPFLGFFFSIFHKSRIWDRQNSEVKRWGIEGQRREGKDRCGEEERRCEGVNRKKWRGEEKRQKKQNCECI
jgi:hypothetical protein